MNPARATTPGGLVAQLCALMDVERIDTDRYRGARQPGGVGRVFGGQVIAQALQAGQRAVADAKVAHSLHASFMRPGSEDAPIDYRVFRDFEGRSFTNARILAMQDDRPILNMIASFHREEVGLSHAQPMPDVSPPEKLRGERELREMVQDRVPATMRDFFLRERPIEFRPVAPEQWLAPEPGTPVQHSWFRVVAPLPDDPALHRAIIAYASDMMLLGTCLLPHGESWMNPRLQTASLDHALWLHGPARADDWLLYTTDSPWSGHGRGLNHGRIFTRDGHLIASSAQEALIRRRV